MNLNYLIHSLCVHSIRFSGNLFLKKILHFHINQIVQIHTKSPHRKIITFSHEIGLLVHIYEGTK